MKVYTRGSTPLIGRPTLHGKIGIGAIEVAEMIHKDFVKNFDYLRGWRASRRIQECVSLGLCLLGMAAWRNFMRDFW